MAVPFITPNWTGNDTFIDFLQYVNYTTDTAGTPILGIGILLIVGFVSFLATKQFSTDRALGFSAFLTLIVAVFLRFLSLISDFVFGVVVFIFVGSVIFLIRERNVEESGV